MDLAVFLDKFLSLHLFARAESLQILHLDLVLRFSKHFVIPLLIFFSHFKVLFDFLSPS